MDFTPCVCGFATLRLFEKCGEISKEALKRTQRKIYYLQQNHAMARNKRTRQERVGDAVLQEGNSWEVAFLVARCSGTEGKKYLVRWDGFTAKDDTWCVCHRRLSCNMIRVVLQAN